MSDWKAMVQKLVQFGDQLPEEQQMIFHGEPPAQRPWPKGVPARPALREFYALCDGASLGTFTIRGLGELEDLRKWSGDKEYKAGRYVIFGDTEFGSPLVWDSVENVVGYHDQDGADGLVMSEETGSDLMGLSLEAFLERLFAKPADVRDETAKLWAETLDRLDRFA